MEMGEEFKPTLKDVQSWMQQQLLDPMGVLIEHPANSIETASLDLFVKGSSRLSAQDHLAIYQRSYIARLRDCMRRVFTVLEYALGEELFESFADLYLEMNPSSSYNLSSLGAKFSEFLASTRPDLHEEVKEDWPDFMIELADFEFTTTSLFDQEDPSLYALASASTADEHLSLVSVLRVFEFRFPIRAYYSDFVNGGRSDLPNEQRTYCAIVRQQPSFRIALFDLHSAQFHFLVFLQKGLSVQEAIEQMVAVHGANELELRKMWEIWRQAWIKAGFLLDQSVLR